MQAITPQEFLSRNYQNIVFAGGGNRCWWQAGVVEVLSLQPCWQAQRLIGASAGAGIATAFATGRTKDSLAAAVERFNATARNFEWRDLLKGQRPFMMPRIYPDWISSFLDESDLEKLKKVGLKIEVVITRPIPYLPLTLSTLLALGLYASEKYWLKNFHARTLLMASAAAVPITPIHRVGGRAALDGGFYDSIPLPQDRQGDPETLVLLTRHRADLPQMFTHQQRVYLQPAQKVAAINMDCTSGTKVQLTYDQGRSEALALMG